MCLTMLQHLYTNYAKISAVELLLNGAAMKTDYDANLPIENLFDQIDTAVEFAAEGGGGTLHLRTNINNCISAYF